jgi:WD40 repeat protein
MTSNKHFKQLVRARMAVTGESYATARTRVQAEETDVQLVDPVVVDVHGRHGQAVSFTPDGTRILSGGQDARVAVLDAATGKIEGELTGHGKVVNAIAVSSDPDVVVSVSSDRTVRLWDLADRSQVAVLEGHRDAVVALDISADGSTAITGGYDGRVRLWDLREQICLQEYRSDLKRIAAVVNTPDGALFAESGQGPRVYARDVEDGAVVAQLDSGAPGVVGLAVAQDGSMLATAGYDGTVRLWDCDSWSSLRDLQVGERANAVCFSRSGQLLAVAAKGRIAIWSFQRDDPVANVDLPISGVYALAFSPDARRLAQTGADGKVRIWTLR